MRKSLAEQLQNRNLSLLERNQQITKFHSKMLAEEHSALLPRHALGGVDSRDSLLGANQIQGCIWGGSLGCDGTVGFERRGGTA